MNADTTEILEATQGTPLGANLFAYCNNNPVNMTDPMGETPLLGVLGGISTGILGGISISALLPLVFVFGVLVIIFANIINPKLFDELFDGLSLGTTISGLEWSIYIALFKLQQKVSLNALLKDISGRLARYEYRNGQERHHIAPRKVCFSNILTDPLCCTYLNKAGINIDSPFNLIYLNASFHIGQGTVLCPVLKSTDLCQF